MALRTKLTELLGIEHPIILAPMGAATGGKLAAAVTHAGGLGLLGVGYSDAEWMTREFDLAGNAPIGAGFITWHLARDPRRLDVALDRAPPAVMLSFGDPAPFATAIKDAGAKLICQVQSVAQAREAVQAGADLIVAQGSEAGGHGASRGTLALVPAVVDAVAPIPVAAAGGITDGRGLAAALMLGAAGALIGTLFYATEECLAVPAAKRRLVDGSGDDTVRTTVFDVARDIDWPAAYTGRAINNDFTRRWHGREDDLQRVAATERERYAMAAAAGDVDTAVVFAGEGIDLIHDIVPAGEVVARLVAEAEACLIDAATLRASSS